MIQKGSVVLYKNNYAIVTECSDKYSIQFSGGSQSVREKDIVLLHEGTVNALSQLDVSTDFSEIATKLDEAWELLQLEDAEAYSFSQIAELVYDDFSATKAFFLYSAIMANPKFSITTTINPYEPQFSLRTLEEAQEIALKEQQKGKEQEIRQEFVNRLKQKKLHLPDDGVFMGEVESLALGKSTACKVMKEAGFSVSPEKAHKLLLDTGVWNFSRNPYPSRFNLSKHSAGEKLNHPPKEERITVDHVAYAIDNKWSTDPDDAIAFDGTYLWVHVADPASTVFPDSAIDIAARDRGATLYLPEGAARMLAEESLSDYALGLAEELDPPQISRALSFKITLDDSAHIEDVEVLKTFVNVERLTYAKADELSDSAYLAPLFEIAQKNIDRRKEAKAVFIDLPEVHMHVEKTQGGVTVSIGSVEPTRSSEVVRECMLLAGEACARFAFKNKIPFPFVSQEAPDIPKEIPTGLAGQYRLRRCMKRRSVSITPSQHSGLGIGMYSQVTSPLRRYSDLVSHQQLRAFIDGRDLLDKDEMLERISAGDAASSATVKAERKSTLHWKLVYLAQNSEWTGEAVVVEIKDKQAVVLIPSIAHETTIGLTNVALNDVVTVKALDINIPELTVKFVVV